VAEFFDASNQVTLDCSSNTYVTCAGTVRAPHGAGVQRKLGIFMDNNLTYQIGSTESVLPLGTFSTQVIALPYTGLTVIALGEPGENSVIHSHCREF